MTSMRNSVSAAVAAMMFAAAAPAHATSFTLESYTVTLQQSDPGLVVWERDLLAEPFVFPTALNNVGDSFTTNLFRIGTKETALNLDDLVPYSINVDFAFSSPSPGFGGNAAGLTGAGWWGDSFGYVAWDNPYTLGFGTTGVLGISLSNETFDLPGEAIVQARFTLLQADMLSGATSVPEPASIVLLGSGLVGAAFRARRRRSA